MYWDKSEFDLWLRIATRNLWWKECHHIRPYFESIFYLVFNDCVANGASFDEATEKALDELGNPEDVNKALLHQFLNVAEGEGFSYLLEPRTFMFSSVVKFTARVTAVLGLFGAILQMLHLTHPELLYLTGFFTLGIAKPFLQNIFFAVNERSTRLVPVADMISGMVMMVFAARSFGLGESTGEQWLMAFTFAGSMLIVGLLPALNTYRKLWQRNSYQRIYR